MSTHTPSANAVRIRRRLPTAEINMIPFLDILLVLLVIFMATTPAITQSVQVNLPKTSTTQVLLEEEALPIIIELNDNEHYTVLIGEERITDLDRKNLLVEITARYALNPQLRFLVGGSATANYQEVITILTLLKTLNIASVGLLTDLP